MGKKLIVSQRSAAAGRVPEIWDAHGREIHSGLSSAIPEKQAAGYTSSLYRKGEYVFSEDTDSSFNVLKSLL